jgi:hypothetical protein
MLTSVDDGLGQIQRAAAEAGFSAETSGPDTIRVHVPFSFFKRQKAARFTGSASSSGRGTDITWTTETPGHLALEYLAEIEEALPEATLYYHGLMDAAARAGLSFTGRQTPRAIVRMLARGETVRALGKGQLDEKPVYVVLSTRRLLVVETSDQRSGTLLDAPHDLIEKLTLGKRISGETLKLVTPDTVTITHLGHGEGHGLAKSFREAERERERSTSMARRSRTTHSIQVPDMKDRVLVPLRTPGPGSATENRDIGHR